MFTTFAGGWPSLVLWMFHRSWHSSVVLGEACALDVNTFLLLPYDRAPLSHTAPGHSSHLVPSKRSRPASPVPLHMDAGSPAPLSTHAQSVRAATRYVGHR